LQGPNHLKRWIIYSKIDEETDKALEPYPQFLRQILYNRGFRSLAEADLYLKASAPLADPFLLTDMDKAVDRLLAAVNKHEEIIVYGDYDVDGVSATVLMVEVI